MSNDTRHEEIIRTRAYFLWIDEGRPDGRDLEFWQRAIELVANERGNVKAPATAPASRRRTVPAEGRPASRRAKRN